MKYSFTNDYSEGAHEKILEAIVESNRKQSSGYGCDDDCKEAVKKIKRELQYEDCDIHFLVGGTQSNLVVIANALRPHEAVIAVDSGHINVHETGAIEASGHKVIAVASVDGKLTCEELRKAFILHSDEHMVKPKMVYISNATEVGTVYYKQELQELSALCHELGLYLFMDGARLGSALTAKDNDVTLLDICRYTDVFYLGGTKNGALFGEAVVIINKELKKDFRYVMKQRGAMLANGRLLGIQFDKLFEDRLYFQLAKHANDMAQKLQQCFLKNGYKLYVASTTNQIFPIVDKKIYHQLQKQYEFTKWCDIDFEHYALRLVTSWATPQTAVDEFCAYLTNITVKTDA